MSLNERGMDRRSFLKTGAGGAAGLLVGFYFTAISKRWKRRLASL